MVKILFMPFGVIGGLLAGLVGKKAFEGVWRLVDDQEAPEPQHRAASWAKLATALALEGAIFRLVRGVFDRGSREVFSRATGRWPGEEGPKPA
jgi:hypothetical protein